METSEQNFWSKVIKTNDCWLWTAYTNAGGYGVFKNNKHSRLAHRFSYALTNGDFDKKLKVLHNCDNPACVNPEHLFLGTQIDNIMDMVCKNRQSGAVGERNSHSKLTEEQVKEIRVRYADRKTSTNKIAKIYGVSQVMISYILINKSWKRLVF